MPAEAASITQKCCWSVPTWLQDGPFFVCSGVDTSAWATSCVMPLWLLLSQLLSFRVCYLRTLVSMLSAWATSCLLFLLLCLWLLCFKTYSALVWSFMLVLLIGCYPYCCCNMPTLLQDVFCLGVVTHMLVLLIGCYPYCCCTMPTLFQDALPVLVFCLGNVAAVATPC